MTKKTLNQNAKYVHKLVKLIEPNFNFKNSAINRFKINKDIKVSNNTNKIGEISNLKKKINSIENCNLKNNSKNLVMGSGDINSPIMIIGETPGEAEDLSGLAFQKDIGDLLNKMLLAIDLKKEKIYLTYSINYRPPLDRKPDSNEIKRYSEFLLEHVDIIKPKIIILLGSTAMEAFFGSNLKISKERGIWKEMLIKDKAFLTMVTFHPAYLLRQNDQKKYSWIDLKNIRNKIDELKIDI